MVLPFTPKAQLGQAVGSCTRKGFYNIHIQQKLCPNIYHISELSEEVSLRLLRSLAEVQYRHVDSSASHRSSPRVDIWTQPPWALNMVARHTSYDPTIKRVSLVLISLHGFLLSH